MTVTKAIVLPPKEAPYLQELTDSNDIHQLVDGWFEMIDLTEPGATLWINDEAAINGETFNQNAMWLLLAHSPSPRTNIFLRSTMVLTGPTTSNDDDITDVDDYFVNLLIKGERFTAEIFLKDGLDWRDMKTPFATWTSAYNAVLELKAREPEVERIRVRPI